jgi:hypothetical protein
MYCPVDLIATFEDSAYVYDWKAGKYYAVDYEMGDAGP